jgi:hypothetical protein
MKKYILILIITSVSLCAFGEKSKINKYSDNKKETLVNNLSKLVNGGKEATFTVNEKNEEWKSDNNIMLKESKKGYTIVYDNNSFLKETNDKYIIKDTKLNFKAEANNIENLKSNMKEKADLILKENFPNDNFSFVKVGVSTDGIRYEDGRIVESISMLYPIYAKTVNGVKIAGKDTGVRVYFKPSGKLSGIKYVNYKSVVDERLVNDAEIVDRSLSEIELYLTEKYPNAEKIEVEYLYLKSGEELIPSYFIKITPGGSSKIARIIPIESFDGVDSIEYFMSLGKDEIEGDSK